MHLHAARAGAGVPACFKRVDYRTSCGGSVISGGRRERVVDCRSFVPDATSGSRPNVMVLCETALPNVPTTRRRPPCALTRRKSLRRFLEFSSVLKGRFQELRRFLDVPGRCVCPV